GQITKLLQGGQLGPDRRRADVQAAGLRKHLAANGLPGADVVLDQRSEDGSLAPAELRGSFLHASILSTRRPRLLRAPPESQLIRPRLVPSDVNPWHASS